MCVLFGEQFHGFSFFWEAPTDPAHLMEQTILYWLFAVRKDLSFIGK